MAELNRKPTAREAVYREAPPSAARKAVPQEERFRQNKEMLIGNARRTATRKTPDYTARMQRSSRTTSRSTPRASASSIGIAGGTAVRQNPYVKKSPSRGKPAKAKKEPRVRERLAKFDYPFFTIVIVLLAFGLIMMFSASFNYAQRETGDVYFYASRQLMFIIVGIVAMIFLSFFDYHVFQNKFILRIAVIAAFALMIFVKIKGTTQGGAERWLSIGEFTFQPSEILKFVVILVFAYLGEKNYEKRGSFKEGFLPFLIFLGVSCTMTLIQPHLSGTIIIFAVGLILMFVSECKLSYIGLMILAFIVLAAIAIFMLQAMGYNYFDSRILSWQNPEADSQGDTYQTYQSLITIGSGGLFGLGLGNSRQKYSYLPASHNDFVFSIVCEELGFIGAMVIILLFVLLVFRGFYIAARARDKFGMLVAVGITVQIGIQALLNIGVVTNSVPNTGISLPFFSYGGSALLMQLGEMGVMLNISRKAAIE